MCLRFPAVLYKEALGILLVFFQTDGVPQREESLLSLSFEAATNLILWGQSMLRVRKLHCTFDKSYCVVSVQIQQMLDLYKSCWLPLLATSLYSSDIYQTLPCAKFERGMETNSSARQALIIAVSKWESEVSILSAPFLQSHPLFLFYYSSLER